MMVLFMDYFYKINYFNLLLVINYEYYIIIKMLVYLIMDVNKLIAM